MLILSILHSKKPVGVGARWKKINKRNDIYEIVDVLCLI